MAGETNKEDWNRLRVVPPSLNAVPDYFSCCLFPGSSAKSDGCRTDRLGPHVQGTAAAKALHALCRGEPLRLPKQRYSLSVQVEAKIPELKRFQNGWATEFLVKEIFQAHKCYSSRKRRNVHTTTRLNGSRQQRQPLPERDEEPRQFITSINRDDNDGALYSPHQPLHELTDEEDDDALYTPRRRQAFFEPANDYEAPGTAWE